MKAHNKPMKKDAHKGKTVRSNLHSIMEGRKNAAHTPRDEKRQKSKLRREIAQELD